MSNKRCLKAEDCLESVKTQLSHITTPKNNSRLQPSSRTEPAHWSPPMPLGPESRNASLSHVGVGMTPARAAAKETTQTTSSPPFCLRDRRQCETRARVKITLSEKRQHAAGRDVSPFLAWVIFTRARVYYPSLLSLRKNGGLLVV